MPQPVVQNPTKAPTQEPMSVTNARQDPNYIGSTVFANLQKQYTPYQIQQATTLKDGNYYWNPKVNIASVPAVAPPSAPLTPPAPSTPNAGTISTYSNAPTPPAGPSDTSGLSSAISAATNTYLKSSIDSTIGNLQQQYQDSLNAQKLAEQAKVNQAEGKINKLTTSTAVQDATEAAQKAFKIKELMSTYSTIQQNIIDAQAALDQGLIFEGQRPVRMAIMTGRQNTLRQQGLALIGTMQATANLVKGNIDIAKGFADQTIQAVKDDNKTQQDALSTLLTLHQQNLVTLTNDEQSVIKDRMKLLTDESDRLETNKSAVFDLISKNPAAAASGKVSFLDSEEAALTKMLPFLSKRDQELYNLEIAAKKRAGTSSGGGTSSTKLYQDYQEDVAKFIQAIDKDPNEASHTGYNTALDALRAKYPFLTAEQIGADLGTARKPAPETSTDADPNANKPGFFKSVYNGVVTWLKK